MLYNGGGCRVTDRRNSALYSLSLSGLLMRLYIYIYTRGLLNEPVVMSLLSLFVHLPCTRSKM